MPISARNAQVAVGITAVRVLPMTAPARTRYAIKNTSPGLQQITISFGRDKTPVALEGIVLEPGDLISDSDSENFECFKGEILAISNLAGGVLSVFEAV